MKCPFCGGDNLDQAKFCSSCGRSVAVVPSGSSTSFRTCVSCGRTIDWNALFCPHCGKDYRFPAGQGGENAQSKKKSRIPLAGGILTILGGIVSFIVFLWTVSILVDPNMNGLSDFGWVTLIITFISAIIAILGGVAAIIRKYYLVALLGAIFSLAGILVFGVPAVILIAISHKDFS